jgi:hypothetical protein
MAQIYRWPDVNRLLRERVPNRDAEQLCTAMQSRSAEPWPLTCVGSRWSNSKGKMMEQATNVACKKCGQIMTGVAEIVPMGHFPGLLAFECDECGATDSVLIWRRRTR